MGNFKKLLAPIQTTSADPKTPPRGTLQGLQGVEASEGSSSSTEAVGMGWPGVADLEDFLRTL
jgi:hypothetical protein